MRRLNEPSHLELRCLTFCLSTLHTNAFPNDSLLKKNKKKKKKKKKPKNNKKKKTKKKNKKKKQKKKNKKKNRRQMSSEIWHRKSKEMVMQR